jgi:chromosome segregation ATPase
VASRSGGQSERGVENGRQAAEAVIRLEDGRDADRLAIVDLKSQVGEISELRRQHEAAIQNADESRRQRNELQDTLTNAQAEIARLVDENKTLLAEQEIPAIELEGYQTGFKKSQAVSADLNHVQTEITILRADNQRLVADNNRLSNENEKMEEVKEESGINQQLADDRLEERQEKEVELRQAKSEGNVWEERAKNADGKAEEIRKNWNIAKNELLDVHRRNRKSKAELKKHANCPRVDMVKQESRI